VGGLASAGLFKLGLHIGGEAAWGLGLRSNHCNPYSYPPAAVIHAWTHQHRSYGLRSDVDVDVDVGLGQVWGGRDSDYFSRVRS